MIFWEIFFQNCFVIFFIRIIHRSHSILSCILNLRYLRKSWYFWYLVRYLRKHINWSFFMNIRTDKCWLQCWISSAFLYFLWESYCSWRTLWIWRKCADLCWCCVIWCNICTSWLWLRFRQTGCLQSRRITCCYWFTRLNYWLTRYRI